MQPVHAHLAARLHLVMALATVVGPVPRTHRKLRYNPQVLNLPTVATLKRLRSPYGNRSGAPAGSPGRPPPAAAQLPKQPRVAVCLVGELRTFSMPIVRDSIVAAVQAWEADVFVHKHTRFDRRNGRARGFHVSCGESMVDLGMLRPKVIAEVQRLTSCKVSAPIQFHNIAHCFVDAAAYAHKYGRPPYDVFVRLRPDVVLGRSAQLPNITAREDRPFVVGPKRDMAFALGPVGLERFIDYGEKEFRSCPRMCCLEQMAYLNRGSMGRRAPIRWSLDLAVVRGPLRVAHASSETFAQAVTERARADPGLMACNITGVPIGVEEAVAGGSPEAGAVPD